MQTVVQLSFSMLILIWLFASFQILSTGCVSLLQDFLGCTIMKKVEEHCSRQHAIQNQYPKQIIHATTLVNKILLISFKKIQAFEKAHFLISLGSYHLYTK